MVIGFIGLGNMASAMVRGIVLVFELPQGLFRAFGRRARP